MDEARLTDIQKLSDEELLGELAAQREELDFLMEKLRVSTPSKLSSMIPLQVSVVLLLASLVFAVAPGIFWPSLPTGISTLSAFLSILFGFALYISFQRYDAEREQRRLIGQALKHTEHVARVADNLLRETGAETSIGLGQSHVK